MLSFPMCTMFERVWRNSLQKIEQGNLLFFVLPILGFRFFKGRNRPYC